MPRTFKVGDEVYVMYFGDREIFTVTRVGSISPPDITWIDLTQEGGINYCSFPEKVIILVKSKENIDFEQKMEKMLSE